MSIPIYFNDTRSTENNSSDDNQFDANDDSIKQYCVSVTHTDSEGISSWNSVTDVFELNLFSITIVSDYVSSSDTEVAASIDHDLMRKAHEESCY